MSPRRTIHRLGRGRRGRHPAFITIILVVLLVVVVVLLMTISRNVIVAQREVRHLELEEQATWLVESARDRWLARRSLDPSYSGESWDIPRDEVQGPWSARVELRGVSGSQESSPAGAVAFDVVVDVIRSNVERVHLVRHFDMPSR